jgi:hypothetical protein
MSLWGSWMARWMDVLVQYDHDDSFHCGAASFGCHLWLYVLETTTQGLQQQKQQGINQIIAIINNNKQFSQLFVREKTTATTATTATSFSKEQTTLKYTILVKNR